MLQVVVSSCPEPNKFSLGQNFLSKYRLCMGADQKRNIITL